MNPNLSQKEYDTLRDAIEELWRIKDDLAAVKHMLGCKGECEIENRIQEVRGMIRVVAEGE
jgi:hypothetical protein